MSARGATKSQFARILGVRPSYVTKLAKAGRLVMTEDGRRVDVDASMDRIRATRDPGRRGVADRLPGQAAEPTPSAAEIAGDEAAEAAPASPSDVSYAAARAMREHYQAQKARLDYELMLGRLCETDAVRAAGMDIGIRMRQALERLPDRLAPELAPCTDPARVRALLVEHIEMALGDLSATIRAAMDGITRDDTDHDAAGAGPAATEEGSR